MNSSLTANYTHTWLNSAQNMTDGADETDGNDTEISTLGDDDNDATLAFEQAISIVVPVFFGVIFLLGLIGNLMVIAVVASNRQMRNTTNMLIINLAVADLLFIVICVPFTAVVYSIPVWPFGSTWCKIYQYAIVVTAYVSVYTLVLMSLDRYLAVVHPIRSMTLRTQRNTIIAIAVATGLILTLNAPTLPQYDVIEYEFNGNRSTCANILIYKEQEENKEPFHGRVFYLCFFVFAYALPLCLVCMLYGLMLLRLLYGGMPQSSVRTGSTTGAAKMKASEISKRRVTRLCVAVVLTFAVCWLPWHITIVKQQFSDSDDPSTVVVKIASNCLVYMNSCMNPILYAFLSEHFRKSFKKLLCRQPGGNTGAMGAGDHFRPLASKTVRPSGRRLVDAKTAEDGKAAAAIADSTATTAANAEALIVMSAGRKINEDGKEIIQEVNRAMII